MVQCGAAQSDWCSVAPLRATGAVWRRSERLVQCGRELAQRGAQLFELSVREPGGVSQPLRDGPGRDTEVAPSRSQVDCHAPFVLAGPPAFNEPQCFQSLEEGRQGPRVQSEFPAKFLDAA